MDTNKAAYWIAVGVLALGLSSEYQHGRFATLHRIAERADLALCRISGHAEEALAAARLLTMRDGSAADSLLASTGAAEMARDHSEWLRDEAREEIELVRDRVQENVGDRIREQIRAQGEMRRVEIEQIYLRTRSQVQMAHMVNRRVMVVCPKTGAQVVVNTGLHSVEISADED
jgi:hypothetical protein